MGFVDYAAVLVLGVFLFAGGSWVLSARKWFVGPLPNVGVDVGADGDGARRRAIGRGGSV